MTDNRAPKKPRSPLGRLPYWDLSFPRTASRTEHIKSLEAAGDIEYRHWRNRAPGFPLGENPAGLYGSDLPQIFPLSLDQQYYGQHIGGAVFWENQANLNVWAEERGLRVGTGNGRITAMTYALHLWLEHMISMAAEVATDRYRMWNPRSHHPTKADKIYELTLFNMMVIRPVLAPDHSEEQLLQLIDTYAAPGFPGRPPKKRVWNFAETIDHVTNSGSDARSA